MVSLRAEIGNELRSIIDDSCREGEENVLAATICVVGRDGKTIFTHASGAFPRNEKPDEKRAARLEDLTRSFSCSKLLTGIITLQLVEEGKADLDSPDFLEQHLPELKAKDKIFSHFVDDDNGVKRPVWKPRTKRITVRMLLNHTSQISNGIVDKEDEAMKAWYESVHPKDESEGSYADFQSSFGRSHFHEEPGTFRYTGGVEWAGMLLERVARQSLADLYRQRIFKPLAMDDTVFVHWCEEVPDVSRVGTPHLRLDGRLVPTPIAPGTTLPGAKPDPDFKPFPESDKHGYPVSMGLLTNPVDYCKILAALLNGGVSPTTGARILSQSSVDMMVTPQLRPEQFKSRLCMDRTTLSIPLDLGSLDPEGNIGLVCAIQGAERVWPDGKTGRSKGSVYWYGASNADWWVDLEKGIAVFANTHTMPWNDPPWVELSGKIEKTLYSGLEAAK